MDRDVTIDWRRVVALSFIIWMVQAGYTTLNTGLFQQFSGAQPRWLAIAIYSCGTAVTWAIFTPIIFWLILSAQQKLNRWYRVVVFHIIAGVLISCAQRYLNIVFNYNLITWTEAVDPGLVKWENFMGFNYIRQVGNSLVAYFVTAGILYGYLYYIKSQNYKIERAQLESNLSKARLESLKYQFQPHFLFNSLQSVSTLMHRDVQIADQSLVDLGELLRHSIKTIDLEKITLAEEIFYLQKYIDLQHMRYEDKLTSNIHIPEALMNTLVPPFILQPIVENSIKHGIEQFGQSILIEIKAAKKDKTLVITCLDNGPLKVAEEEEGRTKRGLANLQLRLESTYDHADLTYSSLPDGGFSTTITIPIEL